METTKINLETFDHIIKKKYNNRSRLNGLLLFFYTGIIFGSKLVCLKKPGSKLSTGVCL